MISTRIHAVLDYAVSLFLLFAPQVFGFTEQPTARATMVAVGAFGLAYTIFTQHELGIFKVIPMPLYIGLDMGSGLFLAAAPWVFGFAEEVMLPHIALGLVAILVAAGTALSPARRVAGMAVGSRR